MKTTSLDCPNATTSPTLTPARGSVPRTVTALFFLALLLCSTPGLAAEGDLLWGFDRVAVPDSGGGDFQHLSDGAGGTFIAYAHGSYPTYLGPVYAARINAAGTVVWGLVLVSDLSAGQSIAQT